MRLRALFNKWEIPWKYISIIYLLLQSVDIYYFSANETLGAEVNVWFKRYGAGLLKKGGELPDGLVPGAHNAPEAD